MLKTRHRNLLPKFGKSQEVGTSSSSCEMKVHGVERGNANMTSKSTLLPCNWIKIEDKVQNGARTYVTLASKGGII
jgi:hypothetical protein